MEAITWNRETRRFMLIVSITTQDKALFDGLQSFFIVTSDGVLDSSFVIKKDFILKFDLFCTTKYYKLIMMTKENVL